MGEVEPGADFIGDPKRVVQRQLALASESIAQRSARYERGDVVQEPVRLARVDERHEMRMREPRGDADLPEKSLRAERGAHFRVQHLDAHLSLVLGLARQI